jgi:hypothetical protein
MAQSQAKQPTSLTAKNIPSWPIRMFGKLNPFSRRIDPESRTQDQKFTMTRFGLIKGVGGQFSDISGSSNQMVINRPSAGTSSVFGILCRRNSTRPKIFASSGKRNH